MLTNKEVYVCPSWPLAADTPVRGTDPIKVREEKHRRDDVACSSSYNKETELVFTIK